MVFSLNMMLGLIGFLKGINHTYQIYSEEQQNTVILSNHNPFGTECVKSSILNTENTAHTEK